MQGHKDIVEVLLDKEVKLTHQDCYTVSGRRVYKEDSRCALGPAALCQAVQFPSIFRLLLDRGATLSRPRSTVSLVLRTEIERSGSKEIADMLLEKGYLIETPEDFQSMNHKKSPSLRLIAWVTKNSVNVHNVFSEAIDRSDLPTINYLLERGCYPNNKIDYNDQSSLERWCK